MPTSYGALCTDFYVNSKLSVKMDLPTERETILHLFDRLRKSEPSMDRFRRYDNELLLESSRREPEYRYTSLRRTSLRAGHANPQDMESAYRFHRTLLDVAPHFLSISPLDVDFLEVMFGFDMECEGNHDQVVYEALFADTPLAGLMLPPGNVADESDAKILDVQPVFGASLNAEGDLQAFYEIKTRTRSRRGQAGRYQDEPLSIFLTLRKYGPVTRLEDLGDAFDTMKDTAENLATERLVPDLLTPIARQIISSGAEGGGAEGGSEERER